MADNSDLESWAFRYLDRTRWTVEGNDGGWVRTMGRRDDHLWQGVSAPNEVPQVQTLGSTAYVRGWCTGAAFASRVSVSRLERALGCTMEQGGWVRTTTSQLERDEPYVLPLSAVDSLLRDDRLDYRAAKLVSGTGSWLEWDMPGSSPWKVNRETGELLIDYLFGGRFRLHYLDSPPPAVPAEWLNSEELRAQFGLELEHDAGVGGEDHSIRLTFAPADLDRLILRLSELVEVDGPVDADEVLEVFLYGNDLDVAWSLARPVLLASRLRPLSIDRLYPSGEVPMQDSELLAPIKESGSRLAPPLGPRAARG